MRQAHWWFILLCATTICLGGCVVGEAAVEALDWLFMGDDDAGPGSGTPADVAGGILGTVIPGGAALISGVGGIWAAIRGKKWKKAFEVTADVIERATESGKAAIDLKGDLAAAHATAGVGTLVHKICTKYDDDPEEKEGTSNT